MARVKLRTPQSTISKQKAHLFFLTFVILIIGASIPAFVWYRYKMVTPPLIRIPIATPPEPAPSQQALHITTDISQWKTYLNPDFHFEFQYPPEFTITVKKEVYWEPNAWFKKG